MATTAQEIHEYAEAYAEAQTYSLNNNYMTRAQKAHVEAWYQLPIGVFGYTVLGSLAIHGTTEFGHAFLVAYVASLVVAIFNWYFLLGSVIKLGFLFAGTISMVVDLSFTAYFIYKGAWAAAGIGIASAFGLICLISPSMYLYTMLSRRMHAKYLFAKRYFGLRFPFEEKLDR